MTITVRPATPADHEAVHQLHLATHAEHIAREDCYDAPSFEDSFLVPAAADKGNGLLIAEVDGTFAGHLAHFRYGNLWIRLRAIGDISVRSPLRRRGVARALVAEVERLAAAQKDNTVVALIWPANTISQATFEALGYTLSRPNNRRQFVEAVRTIRARPARPRWVIPLSFLIILVVGYNLTALGL